MFQDLDASLLQLLTDPGIPSALGELRNADISFETPDRNFTPSQTTLNLFLYEVKQNRELRDPLPVDVRIDDTDILRLPPLRVDCSYIITAWGSGSGAARTATEHQLLAQALLWLSRFATLPDVYFQGGMIGQPYPPPMGVALLDPNVNSGTFWSALGVSPRAAIYLTITISMDLGVSSLSPIVTTLIAWYQQDGNQSSREELITIGGTVLLPSGLPALNAWVKLDPTGSATQVDENGRFVFMRVPRGSNYVLTASLAGTGQTTINTAIPSDSGEYNLQL